MSTIVEFRLLVLNSLKYSSKAELPINRSAKAIISRNLTTSHHNYFFISLFLYLVIYLFIYLFDFYLILFYFIIFFPSFFNFLFYFSYIYRKQALPSYLHSDSNRCYWLASMNKKIKNIYL